MLYALMAERGWEPHEDYGVLCVMERDALEIVYRDGCAHFQRLELPVYACGGAAAVVRHIDEHEHERRCYCVRRAR